MKIRKLFLIVPLLLSIIGVASCETEVASCETGGDNLNPIIPDDAVIAFFQEYLPSTYSYPSGCYFFDSDDIEVKCVMINSADEFEKSFSCSPDILPAIDFKSNTLIIGHFQTANEIGRASCRERV